MASNDVCEHQNTNYLRMMSERDALRDVVRELDAVMHHHAERADAAEAEVERLREGIFAAATVLNREFYRLPATWVGRLAADLRALLAGSGGQSSEDERAWLNADPRKAAENLRAVVGAGEQPGEVDGYCTCHDDQKGRTRDCGVKAHREAGRPAPVALDSGNAHEPGDDEHTPGVNVTQPAIPDSTDVLREAEAALIRATKGDDPTAWAGTGWWHVHRLLAAVGPLAERTVGERVAREIERLGDALVDDPDRAALELLIEDAASIARGEGS